MNFRDQYDDDCQVNDTINMGMFLMRLGRKDHVIIWMVDLTWLRVEQGTFSFSLLGFNKLLCSFSFIISVYITYRSFYVISISMICYFVRTKAYTDGKY